MRLVTKLGLTAAAALMTATARDARACGGCFHPPTQSGTVVTDHRMIFSVSPQQTTLYDEIKYSGAPSSFAWVLPIHGKVGVGLSADIVFSALEQATKTSIVAPALTPCPICGCPPVAFGGVASASADASAGPGGVTVISQQVVGPYDTVQLHPNTTSDTKALTDWLTVNGYTIPADVQPVIAAYVSEGFDFLALRLQPGQGIQAMRPVSVTTPGAGLSLPLRMVAAGTGATVGITLWVVGSGRYEPKNFPFFTISPSDLTWDWSKNTSDYTTVQASKEAATSNFSWQVESSLDLSPLQIENTVLYGFASFGGVGGGPVFGGFFDGGTAPASQDYQAVPASDAGPGETADQARTQDLATLFPLGNGTVRITRMRGDLSRAALTNDLILQASADQSALSSVYQVTKSINAPVCQACSPSQPVCGGSGSSGGLGGSGGSASSSGSFGGSGSSSGGPFGGVDDGGTAGGISGSLSGGATSSNAAPGQSSFSCSTSPAAPIGAGFAFSLAGLAVAGLARARGRRADRD